MTDPRSDVEASDRELARRVAQDGDEAAFRALYRRHTPALYQFVLRLLAAAEQDAEEVVQDTWIRAVRGLPGFRWEASFRTWLTGIGLNRAREEFRRRRRDEAPLPDGLEGAVPPERIPDRLDLERAIAGLPDGYRTVLVLHDVEGFSHQEISHRLEIAVGTSRSQLFHARRAVRRALTPPSRREESHERP